MLVQLQPSALFRPGGATEQHQTLRRSGSGFKSRPGFEGRGTRGARTDRRRLSRPSSLVPRLSPLTQTLELDGQATGCKPVEVGSIPTGVFPIRATGETVSRWWLISVLRPRSPSGEPEESSPRRTCRASAKVSCLRRI